MIELDVQMAKDGRLIAFHDNRLERTTNGRGRVTNMPYASLAHLDAGSWFHKRFAGERILLLSQAVRLVPSHIRLNLELKRTRKRRALIRRFIRIVRQQRLTKRLLVSSFDPYLLRMLSKTRLHRALICKTKPDQSLEQAIRIGCSAWHPYYTLATKKCIAKAHAAGLSVNVWLISTPRQARQLIRHGADGVFTNNPAKLFLLRQKAI